jgi:mRNA-degrading endonuclease toxin of MazEF toxin-antitoxin module
LAKRLKLQKGLWPTSLCSDVQGKVCYGKLVEAASGNVLLKKKLTGFAQDPVANVSQLVSIDKQELDCLVGRIDEPHLRSIFRGIDLVLGRA